MSCKNAIGFLKFFCFFINFFSIFSIILSLSSIYWYFSFCFTVFPHKCLSSSGNPPPLRNRPLEMAPEKEMFLNKKTERLSSLFFSQIYCVKYFPCQRSSSYSRLSISLMTETFFRLQSGAKRSSPIPSPVSRAITVSGGSRVSAFTTRSI